MPDATIRRSDQLLCGRLVAMPTTLTRADTERVTKFNGLTNIISIDFPAMPDAIELARSADYAVTTNLVLPDGVHQYKGTKPLEIPISFKLHSQDKVYCTKGALTLLQLAARLHSFILPISTFKRGVLIAPLAPPTTTKAGGGRPSDAATEARASQEAVFGVAGTGKGSGAIHNPVTCWLHLLWTANQSPGISAVGYVRDVKVILNGPWMRGPNNSFNLPTSADFSFTFVHRPGHGNALPVTNSSMTPVVAESTQAFADDVKDSLYNTRDLVSALNFQGFATNPSGVTN